MKHWLSIIALSILCIMLIIYGNVQHRRKNQPKHIYIKENILHNGIHTVDRIYIGYRGLDDNVGGSQYIMIGDKN